MKTLIFLVIYGFATQLRADDLLTGYSLLISSASTQAQLELNVKPSFERAPIKDKYKTLVFVFMNGVNDLGILNYSLSDINEMEMFGSTDDMAVVAEHNAILSDSQGFIRFSKGASTYFIEKDTSPTIISRVISYTPDGDMGSARHLAISAKKVLKRFKPDRFIMIVWNHGNGYFGIAYDDVSGNSMSVKDLSYALSEIRKAYGRKIDVFAMDACLMQMAEVVAEIKDYASFIVASQELVPGPGYPYDDVLKAISMTSSAKDAAIGIVDAYYNAYSSGKMSVFGRYYSKDITLSVIDTSKYLNFISLLNRWVMLATKSSDFQIITSSSVKENIFFFSGIGLEIDGVMTKSADLVDYLEMAKSRMKDRSLKGETSGLIDFVKNKLVIYHKAGDFQNFQGFSYSDRTHGIAIYLPKLRYNSQVYEGLRFCKESLWDEFLKGDLSDELNPSLYSYHIGIDVEGKDEEDKVIEDERKTLRVVSGVDKKNLSVFEKEDKADNIASLKTLDNEKQRERKLLDKSNYPNIYSTSYTTTKTLVPTKESLLELSGIEKSKLLKGSLDKTAKKKEQISSDTSLLLKNVVEKSKETAKILLASVSDEAKRIKDVFFEDKNEKDRYLDILNKFEVEITTNMSVEFSKKLFDDPKLQKNLIKVDRNRASKLISYSASIIELDRMLSKDYSDGDVNVLSSYLSSTLDRSSQICELGICVPPENLVEKMMRKNAGRYDLSKITFTEKAIRKWEYIFSDEAYFFKWGQARGVKVSSQTWLNMSVKERNASLSWIVSGQLRSGTTVLISLTPAIYNEKEKKDNLKVAVDNIEKALLEKGFLKDYEIKALEKKSLEEQAYILANLFDRSGIKTNSQLSREIAVINANRTSFINEVIDQKNRAILSNYISNNIKNELASSKTASDLYSKLYSKKTPSILVDYTGKKDSISDGNRIVVDASLIEQYMRVRGYSVDNLKDEKVRKEILAYISPLIVKEMASMYIALKNKDSSFDVREKYASALLYEARYIEENRALKDIFSPLHGYVDYADRVDALKRLYRTSDNNYDFIQRVGLRYYSNLPSASVARSEMLSAVTNELEKRARMSANERKKADEYAIFTYADVSKLTPFEIAAHASSFTTDALLKLQQALLSQNNFASFYDKMISSL